MGGAAAGRRDLNDVRYDALLANRRPPSDPEVVRVLPGRTVRLRIINGASGTNVLIRTGALSAVAIAVDGAPIVPLPARVFELAVAEGGDVRLRIPHGAGVYPIVAHGEGTDMLAALVLATPDAAVPSLPVRSAAPTPALTNRQELRLRAAAPLPPRRVDRSIRVALPRDMGSYTGSLNGRGWPGITPGPLGQGERARSPFLT